MRTNGLHIPTQAKTQDEFLSTFAAKHAYKINMPTEIDVGEEVR
jgi:hypothetical protein